MAVTRSTVAQAANEIVAHTGTELRTYLKNTISKRPLIRAELTAKHKTMCSKRDWFEEVGRWWMAVISSQNPTRQLPKVKFRLQVQRAHQLSQSGILANVGQRNLSRNCKLKEVGENHQGIEAKVVNRQ